MDIQLDLSDHCIETELKRQYNRLVSKYFKAVPEERDLLEPKLEMLRIALETLDFGWLRARCRLLCGAAAPHKITLSREGGNFWILIDDRKRCALDRP